MEPYGAPFEEEDNDPEKEVCFIYSTLTCLTLHLYFFFVFSTLYQRPENTIRESIQLFRSQDYIMEPSIFETLQRYSILSSK